MSALKICHITRTKTGSKGHKNVGLPSSSDVPGNTPSPIHHPPSSIPNLTPPAPQKKKRNIPLSSSLHFTARFLALTLCVNMKKCHFIATMRRIFVEIYCAYATLYNKYALKCPPILSSPRLCYSLCVWECVCGCVCTYF